MRKHRCSISTYFIDTRQWHGDQDAVDRVGWVGHGGRQGRVGWAITMNRVNSVAPTNRPPALSTPRPASGQWQPGSLKRNSKIRHYRPNFRVSILLSELAFDILFY